MLLVMVAVMLSGAFVAAAALPAFLWWVLADRGEEARPLPRSMLISPAVWRAVALARNGRLLRLPARAGGAR